MADVTFLAVDDARHKIASLGERKIKSDFSPGKLAILVGGDGEISIDIGGIAAMLTKQSIKSLGWILQVPKFVYGIKDEPELQGRILEYCRKRAPSGDFMFTIRGGSLLSVTDAKYPSITPEEAFETVTSVHKGFAVESLTLNEPVEARLVDMGIQGSPNRDKKDVTFGGMILEADGSVTTGEYLWRQVCTNGMRRQVKFTEIVAGTTTEQLKDNLRVQTQASMEYVRAEFMKDFMHSAEIKIQNPAAVLHRIARSQGLPARVEARLMDKIPSLDKEPSYYDLINIVTEYGRDMLADGQDKAGKRVATFASAMVSDTKAQACSHCHAPIA